MRSTIPSKLTRRSFLRASALTGAGLVLPSGFLAGCGDDDGGQAAIPLEVDPSIPWWMQNNFDGVFEERSESNLAVRGSIPSSLDGLYVRNGSNPQSGVNTHWFLGDGMLHGVRLRDGQALWYRNRYTQTPLYVEGLEPDEAIPLGPNNNSNVSPVYHAGRLLTSGEVGFPFEIDPSDMSTIGPQDFGGNLETSFTAHPKIDPVTGHMHAFGYLFGPPFVTYYVIDANGDWIHSQVLDARGPTMMHSFAITDREAIFWELPVTFQPDLFDSGFPYGWDASFGARIGVLPLGGSVEDMRWVEIEPCYVFHELNAYRDGDEIVIDVMRYDRMMDGERFGSIDPMFTRWRVDTSGESLGFRDELLDDRPMEFPVHDRRFTGRRNRYGWFTTTRDHPDTIDFQGVAMRDQETGAMSEWDPGANRQAGEAFFVPEGDAEGEGWLLTFVYDRATDTTDLAILDAMNVRKGPVAEIRMPQRVPFGFHGVWIPA